MIPRLFIAAALVALSSVAAAQTVDVTLSEWKLRLSPDTVRAGSVTFRLSNDGAVTHALHVQGQGVDKSSQPIPPRQSGSLVVTLKPGTYEVYCPMSEDSHKKAGMLAKLTVTDAAAPAPPEKPQH
jgi:uncharacterized cupredoxin-like copper-binding protein